MPTPKLVVPERATTARQLQSVKDFIKEYSRAHDPIEAVEVHEPPSKLVEGRK
jgi:hypothetical protein